MGSWKWVVGYASCVIVGCFVAFQTISLPPVVSEKTAVDLKVHVPEPTVIHDTIIKPDVKYKYISKKICCCGSCIRDSVK